MEDQSTIFDKIQEVDLKERMETFYIDYAMSVIASRALPDVRDGLKPVQRRILYSMIELNNGPDKPHRKCARIVGDTMGKYHPHGDSSIYGALVNMAQDWSMRCTLVDGHGNFGSVDGDGAAAMRYTEARLSKISMEMMADINKDTVDFVPNFDETEKEPVVMPARFPNLLVNGTTGIAVGMATNIPPHNLTETINAVIKIIDNKVEENRETEIEELMEIVKGPDFPTGAMILGRKAIEQAYRTGRAKIKVRAVTNIETMPSGRQRIVATELPYLVNKAKLIEKIAELVKEKKIEGISDLRDESDREGMRVVIELKKDANANVILNHLYKHTQLQDTFGVNMLALVDNQPVVLNLKMMLEYYLKHQEEVVTRRTRYELNKAEERAHILQGLLIALDNIDEVVSIIRSSGSVAEAKSRLMERFGLSEAQSQAIVDMRLRALTGLEREKLQNEYDELMRRIGELKAILADEKLLLGVIKNEIGLIRDKYGDQRRTSIGYDAEEISIEDLVKKETTVIAMTRLGYVKRMTMDNFKSQNRGGRGIKGMTKLDEDAITDLMMAGTHDHILMFTDKGRVFHLRGYDIPEASRTARGTAVINLLQLDPEEKISAMIPVNGYHEEQSLIMATRNGVVKKTKVTQYLNIRKTGLIAISMREDDALIEVKVCEPGEQVLLVTRKGMSICFNEHDVRDTGRSSMGVRGIELDPEDAVIAMQITSMGSYLLAVSEKGLGKRTRISEFNIQKRGGKGLKCYKLSEKTGDVAAAKCVDDDEEVMIITTDGIIIRMSVNDVSVIGRITSGVKMIQLEKGAAVAVMTRVTREMILEAALLEAEQAAAGDAEAASADENAEDDEENASAAGNAEAAAVEDTAEAVNGDENTSGPEA